jgi:hypothetical protein
VCGVTHNARIQEQNLECGTFITQPIPAKVSKMANDGTERRIIGIMDGTKHYGDRGENLITKQHPAPGIAGVL